MKKLLSLSVVASLLFSCSGSQKAAAVGQVAIDCAKADLGQTVASAGLSVLMTVVGIIFSGGATWQSDLAALEAKYGPEVLACAEQVAEELFRTPAPAVPATGDMTESPHDRALKALGGKKIR